MLSKGTSISGFRFLAFIFLHPFILILYVLVCVCLLFLKTFIRIILSNLSWLALWEMGKIASLWDHFFLKRCIKLHKIKIFLWKLSSVATLKKNKLILLESKFFHIINIQKYSNIIGHCLSVLFSFVILHFLLIMIIWIFL